MAFERVKFYRLIDLDIRLDAAATLKFETELMNITLSLSATVGRQPVKVRLPGNAKGRYAKLTITPAGTARLFGALVWAKHAGESLETPWTWAAGPVDGTPESWTAAPLPIPPTPEEWGTAPLPIPPTSEEWARLAVPIPATPDMPEWAELPVDQ